MPKVDVDEDDEIKAYNEAREIVIKKYFQQIKIAREKEGLENPEDED